MQKFALALNFYFYFYFCFYLCFHFYFYFYFYIVGAQHKHAQIRKWQGGSTSKARWSPGFLALGRDVSTHGPPPLDPA